MPVPIVIDLSHHNTIPVGLEEAKAYGIVGCIHKATEGGSYVDSDVDARWFLAQRAGMLWGLYHFMRPGDQVLHAQHFVKQAELYGDANTLLVADHEDPGVSLDDLLIWLEEVEALTDRVPMVYSGHVLKDQLKGKPDHRFDKYRLWLAQYGNNPVLPPGWMNFWLWQYTDQGSIPGVNPPVDLNAGDVLQVMAEWSGAIVEPLPPPEPPLEIPVVTVDIQAPEDVVVVIKVNGQTL